MYAYLQLVSQRLVDNIIDIKNIVSSNRISRKRYQYNSGNITKILPTCQSDYNCEFEEFTEGKQLMWYDIDLQSSIGKMLSG